MLKITYLTSEYARKIQVTILLLIAVTNPYLNKKFGQHWIGRSGPVSWPPMSPDLTPLTKLRMHI